MSGFTERTSEPPRLKVRPRLAELWIYREILANLVRKELKVKYTASVLGAVWSVLNPLVFMGVFWFVAKVFGGGPEDLPIFLLCGLLAWNLFSVALSNGSQAVLSNANIVKKVYFPREILPLATVGIALVDFVLQSAVFLAFLVLRAIVLPDAGFPFGTLWLYPLAFVALMVFSTAVALLVSAINVRYRDLQHLIGLGLLVWFWMTPIVYAPMMVYANITESLDAGELLWRLYLLNPVAWIAFGFQGALYDSADAAEVLAPFDHGELALGLAVVIGLSSVLLYASWRVFFRLSGDFAEEL